MWQDQSAPSEGEVVVATGTVKLRQKGELVMTASDCLYFECGRHCSFYFLLVFNPARTWVISKSQESHLVTSPQKSGTAQSQVIG